ncbi:hypothetical protein HED60_07375 [Planctomycetales bacterium ZRK34]|nr:hypothetical protein HED60_07375 [Planctomycetales bacterium ZRK34]
MEESRRGPRFKVGDPVVCSVTKYSAHPGSRARDIDPESLGEKYRYVVDKYWVVSEILPDNTCVLRTRRGKQRRMPIDAPNLRHARLWERLFFPNRFPDLPSADSSSA